MAYNPMVQHQVASMYLELDAATATLDRYLAGWTGGADLTETLAQRTYSMKWRAAEAAKRVVDTALDVVGGAGMFKGSELERLYRDAALRRVPPRERRPDARDRRSGDARGPGRAASLVSRGQRARSACSTAASPSSTAPSASASA